ncbi:class V chitinase-like [Juglans regia]|uniref:Class V chitinase-like n=2 Tax=Juglans regia TaxID=51240 RepID=A0A2I4H2J4_JUGRE|nr:class V chitinase-like [Juglans regia]
MASSGGLVKAGYWSSRSSLPVAAIESTLFTHLYAGFAEVRPADGGVTFPKDYKVQFQKFTETVQRGSPNVKTLLSIGGEGPSPAKILSLVVGDQNKRAKFIQDSIALARNYDFHGLDLCWLYPSSSDDDADLDSFLNEWRAAIDEDHNNTRKDRLLLTAAVFHHPVIRRSNFNYPIQAIKDNLDWINVLAIDFYTPASNSSGETGPVHAWRTRSEDLQDRCGEKGIQNWINNRVATNQLLLALPFYGYEWILGQNSNNRGFFAPAHPGNKLPLSYKTIQETLARGNYTIPVTDGIYVATYSHNDKRSWIGYDDERSISEKVKKAVKANLGGYFAWNVGFDDDNWTLSRAAKNACDPPAGANQ